METYITKEEEMFMKCVINKYQHYNYKMHICFFTLIDAQVHSTFNSSSHWSLTGSLAFPFASNPRLLINKRELHLLFVYKFI